MGKTSPTIMLTKIVQNFGIQLCQQYFSLPLGTVLKVTFVQKEKKTNAFLSYLTLLGVLLTIVRAKVEYVVEKEVLVHSIKCPPVS